MKDSINRQTVLELIAAGHFFGLSKDVPADAYHAAHDYVGSTGLKLFRTASPAHYQAALKRPPEQTPALRLGSALHSMILEPHLQAVVGMPQLERRTKEGKARAEAFEQENQGKIILSAEEFARAQAIAAKVLANPIVKQLLREGDSEVSAFATCSQTGLKVKARADRLILSKRAILDFKSTTDASPREFSRSAANFGYFHAAAHYIDVFEAATSEQWNGFVLVAFEKDDPYEVGVYELEPEEVEFARRQNRDAKERLKRCQDEGLWPGYSPQIERLRAPKWAFSEGA